MAIETKKCPYIVQNGSEKQDENYTYYMKIMSPNSRNPTFKTNNKMDESRCEVCTIFATYISQLFVALGK